MGVPDDPRDLEQSGFKSGAAEFVRSMPSLDQRLGIREASVFFFRVRGDEHRILGLRHGDLLVVDRARDPRHGSLAVIDADGRLRIRRMRRWGAAVVPVSLHRACDIDPLEAVEVWGVVSAIVRELEQGSREGEHGED